MPAVDAPSATRGEGAKRKRKRCEKRRVMGRMSGCGSPLLTEYCVKTVRGAITQYKSGATAWLYFVHTVPR